MVMGEDVLQALAKCADADPAHDLTKLYYVYADIEALERLRTSVDPYGFHDAFTLYLQCRDEHEPPKIDLWFMT